MQKFVKLFGTLCLAVALAGESGFAAGEDGHDHDHGHHHHVAPHGGTLIELGEEFAHVELVLDGTDGQLTAYVLDGEAQNAVRVKQSEIKLQVGGGDVGSTVSVSLKAVGNPLTGEKPGDTSQFESGAGPLKNKKNFSLVIENLSVKGQVFDKVSAAFPGGNH